MKIIGLMSGTSADGVDAALVDISEFQGQLTIKLLSFQIYPYPDALQKELIRLASGKELPVSVLCHLNVVIGEIFAEAVTQLCQTARFDLSDIHLIGSHGQTVQHLPEAQRFGDKVVRSTLQIGCPSVIAERTGVTTISDFRTRDMAAGGEGAPLTPYFHFHLLQDRRKSRVVINLGGISNLTYLKADTNIDTCIAFDMGPANMLIDAIVSKITQGEQSFDAEGKLANRGSINPSLLSELMQHPFIRKEPPKSTGREMFGEDFSKKIFEKAAQLGLSENDVVATTTAFSAEAIAENIRCFIQTKGTIDEVIVGGGGVLNPVLMAHLKTALAGIPILRYEDFGHDSRAIEAMTFALLAYQTKHQRPSNIPSVTGARKPVVLGSITPGHSV